MPRPTALPAWATSLANRLAPSSSLQISGWLFANPLPANISNYLWGLNSDWAAWLGEVVAFEQVLALGKAVADSTRPNVPLYTEVRGNTADTWGVASASAGLAELNIDVTDLVQVPVDSLQRVITGFELDYDVGNVADTVTAYLVEVEIDRGNITLVNNVMASTTYTGATGRQAQSYTDPSPETIKRNTAAIAYRYLIRVQPVLQSGSSFTLHAISVTGTTGRAE